MNHGDWFIVGCLVGVVWVKVVQPLWNHVVDKLFDRYWP